MDGEKVVIHRGRKKCEKVCKLELRAKQIRSHFRRRRCCCCSSPSHSLSLVHARADDNKSYVLVSKHKYKISWSHCFHFHRPDPISRWLYSMHGLSWLRRFLFVFRFLCKHIKLEYTCVCSSEMYASQTLALKKKTRINMVYSQRTQVFVLGVYCIIMSVHFSPSSSFCTEWRLRIFTCELQIDCKNFNG